MTVAHLDFETFSAVDLSSTGADKYAEHESTEILVACFAFDDEEVQTWVPGRDGPLPERLRKHIESGQVVCAHNYNFERVISNGTAGRKAGFPGLSIAQGRCTAAKAAANGLPRALADAANALSTSPKDEAGRITMLQLSKPKKPSKVDPSPRYTRELHPEKFATLDAYCADDVRAERALDHATPDLAESEQDVWRLDAEINDRGISVDLDAIGDILAVVDEYKGYLATECEELTRDWLTGEGLKPTQRDKLAEWVRANGYPLLPDMQGRQSRRLSGAAKHPTL